MLGFILLCLPSRNQKEWCYIRLEINCKSNISNWTGTFPCLAMERKTTPKISDVFFIISAQFEIILKAFGTWTATPLTFGWNKQPPTLMHCQSSETCYIDLSSLSSDASSNQLLYATYPYYQLFPCWCLYCRNFLV